MDFPIDQVRAEFPALATRDGGEPIYFDAPGGTQACRPAIAAMAAHLEGGSANSGGAFAPRSRPTRSATRPMRRWPICSAATRARSPSGRT